MNVNDKITLRLHHYSIHTGRTYIDWIKRCIAFQRMKSREDLANGERKIEAFLTRLAVDEQVASATQNQAMNALVFLYRRVFQLPLNETINAVRADRKVNVPVVLTREEVVKVISLLEGAQQLIVKLLYGSGLRIMEAVRSPTLHTTWAPRHVQPEIFSGGQRNTQKIFGAVAVLTGQSLFRHREAQFNHDTYVEFLEDMTKFFFRRGPPHLLDPGQCVVPQASHHLRMVL